MKDIALDWTAVLQIDADVMDGALDAAQTVTSCAMTLPSISAPSPIRRSEARNSPLIRPKTCAGPLHSMLPTIDIPGANTRAWHRIRSRLPPGRRLFDDRVLLLHRTPHDFTPHDFGRICRRFRTALGLCS